jgi:hypothetical protein
MLQILSTSNETATGPELVTNGDFTATPLGSELVSNGDFSGGTFSPWANNPNWSLGGVGAIADGTSDATLWQSGVVEDNKSYKVTYTLSDFTQGSVNVDLGGTNGATRTFSGAAAVTYTDYIVAGTSPTTRISFEGSGNFIVTLSNVSVKEDINLITNGDFSATGTELVDNNDFLNGTDDWTDEGSSTISVGTHEGRSNVADINITGTSTGDVISHSFSWTEGSSYKVTCDVYVVSGSFRIDSAGSVSSNDFVSTNTLGEWQTLTGYVTSNITGSQNFWLRSMLDGATGEVSQFYVDSVSIKELGADWSVSAVGGISFNGSGLSLNSSEIDTSGGGTVYSACSQLGSIFDVGKSYKLVIEDLDITSGSIELKFGLNHATTPARPILTSADNGTYVYYLTAVVDSDSFTINSAGGTVATLSSISVQELGEDWTQGNGWTIGDSKAISAQGLGGELITNGDFSATTATKILDGDFPLPNVNWTVIPTTTINGGSATIEGLGSLTTTGNYWGVSQDVTGHDVGKSYKVTFTAKQLTGVGAMYGGVGYVNQFNQVITADYVIYTFYQTITTTGTNWDEVAFGGVLATGAEVTNTFEIKDVSVEELGEDWTFYAVDATNTISIESGGARVISTGVDISLRQTILEVGKSYKLTCDTTITTGKLGIANTTTGSGNIDLDEGSNEKYFTAASTQLIIKRITGVENVLIDNISVEEIATSYLAQSGILTVNRTYKFGYTISNYSAGTVSATDYGAVKDEDEVVLDTVKVGSTDFSIKNIDGYFVGDIESVSAKLLGTYSDQSIYVTAADVQTIAQASVYYLVALTSMASKNSLYFLPSSVVANNGRYTKLNFTVISKDATPTPAVGIISFYDSVGGFDTYPMGFYEFRIYEQTSSTNLDPLLATGLLEKGFAFVRDFSGNMQELPDGFNEYDPTLTQYVYSK